MRTLSKLLFASALVILGTSSADAQFQPGGRNPFGGQADSPSQLIRNKSVQEELKISADDATKLNTQIQEAVTKATLKALEDGLKPDQYKRFKQIRIQQMGLRAFADTGVVGELKLSDEQTKKITAMRDDLQKDIQDMLKDVGMDFRKMQEITREKVPAMNKEAMAKVSKMLSEDQQKTWKTMVGEAFELKQDRPGRPGGTDRRDF